MTDFPCCEPGAKPPFGSDARAEYDRKEAAFPQLDALRYAATYGQASEDEASLFIGAADELERLRAECNAMADHINQLAADWQTERDLRGKALRETDSWRAAAGRIDERAKRLEAELVDVKTSLASAHKKIDESEAAVDQAYKDGYETGKAHAK